MEIVNKKLADLKAAEYNPREITQFQIDELKKSIQQFGIVEPVVVNSFAGRENVVIGGHQRVKACEQLGMVEIPCFMISVDPTKEKLLNLALNRVQGNWDEVKLTELIFKIKNEERVENIIGFMEQEVDQYMVRRQLNLEAKEYNPDGEYNPDEDEEMKKLFARNERVPVGMEEPEMPVNKQRLSFYMENFEDYNLVRTLFQTGRKGELDQNKLMEMVRKMQPSA